MREVQQNRQDWQDKNRRTKKSGLEILSDPDYTQVYKLNSRSQERVEKIATIHAPYSL